MSVAHDMSASVAHDMSAFGGGGVEEGEVRFSDEDLPGGRSGESDEGTRDNLESNR